MEYAMTPLIRIQKVIGSNPAGNSRKLFIDKGILATSRF